MKTQIIVPSHATVTESPAYGGFSFDKPNKAFKTIIADAPVVYFSIESDDGRHHIEIRIAENGAMAISGNTEFLIRSRSLGIALDEPFTPEPTKVISQPEIPE